MTSSKETTRDDPTSKEENPFATGAEVKFGGGRPWVESSNVSVQYLPGRETTDFQTKEPKFRLNQEVYISESHEGPYLIAKVNKNSTPIKYTLSLGDGTPRKTKKCVVNQIQIGPRNHEKIHRTEYVENLGDIQRAVEDDMHNLQ